MKKLDMHEVVWVEYHGFIVAESERGIGLGKTVVSRPELWLPKSQVSRVCYQAIGDSKDIAKAELLTGIKIPRWLGHSSGLLALNK